MIDMFNYLQYLVQGSVGSGMILLSKMILNLAVFETKQSVFVSL